VQSPKGSIITELGVAYRSPSFAEQNKNKITTDLYRRLGQTTKYAYPGKATMLPRL